MSTVYVDLQAQQARMGAALRDRMDAVLAHGQFVRGPEIAELEARLAEWCGARHAITCASGTTALLLPLMAWGVGHGHAVFVPDFGPVAGSAMPTLMGATPVFVDVETQSRNMSAESLEKAIIRVKREGKLTAKAVIPAGLFGQACQMPDILDISRAHGLLALEDAAHSFGALRHSIKACNMGCNAASTSFSPTLPLGCYGSGGAVFTNDDKLATRLFSLRACGKEKGLLSRIGLNACMDTLQAAVLLAKLDIFAEELALRQTVAQWYAEQLPDCVEGPRLSSGCTSTWSHFTVLLPDMSGQGNDSAQRQALLARLEQICAKTGTQEESETPACFMSQHSLPVFAHLGYKPGDLPVSLELSRRILRLPLHPYMDEAEVRRVCGVLKEFCTI